MAVDQTNQEPQKKRAKDNTLSVALIWSTEPGDTNIRWSKTGWDDKRFIEIRQQKNGKDSSWDDGGGWEDH